MNLCRLCGGDKNFPLVSIQQKFDGKLKEFNYHKCKTCRLISLDPSCFLGPLEEKSRYETHNNSLSQPKYVNHLNKLWSPLKNILSSEAKGLDFGSGPQPCLAQLIRQDSFDVDIWDPFFAKNNEVWKGQYDFVTCMEVIEHCAQVSEEINKIYSVLKPHGHLAVGTVRYDNVKDFSSWYYRMDPTHISFFSISTMEWISQNWNLKLEYIEEDVVIFKKLLG
jgi:SAM-dependent methyltransferase